jgi:hypothetical protein
MQKLTNRQIYWAGFIVIVVVYSLYNLYLADVTYYRSISIKLRHVLKFLLILVIYGTGTFALKRYTPLWMMQLWHLIHIVIIVLLLMIGVYDWGVGKIPISFRNIADTLFEFLISPLIYIAVGILSVKFGSVQKHKPV